MANLCLNSARSGPQFIFTNRLSRLSTRFYCTESDKVVTIGSVKKTISIPTNPELVPKNYLPENIPKETMKDLKWMMQKDLLGQDMFLLGRPGPLRRTLAQQYLELTQREMEYVSLSRDTTESDLKQRREISGGTAQYVDQSAVKAATEGRVLVLEGIEKVERNVLPVLNNLLENREMHLEDGRLLIPAPRYDKLLADHGKEVMDLWRLVRVSEEFRVIALGLPVPKYVGSPLDPPLRSRFQARDVRHLPFGQQLDLMMKIAPNVDKDSLSQILSFSHTLLTEESSGLGLPDFPIENLPHSISILNSIPDLSHYDLLTRLYPYKLFLDQNGQKSVEDTLQTFQLLPSQKSQFLSVDSVSFSSAHPHSANVNIQVGKSIHSVTVPSGSSSVPSTSYVPNAYHNWVLADMLLSHSVGDVCLIGPRGCGKTALVKQMTDLLGYKTETIQLYADMTARDLLQQRTTTETGDTVWRLSPLVEAAIEGKLAVLDGLHRVHRGTLAVLQRLVHDRELQLYDGSRLIGSDKFELIKEENGFSDQEMIERGIRVIHPAFRLFALAEPPSVGTAKGQWLSPEILSMFSFHEMRSLSQKEEGEVLTQMAGTSGEVLEDILRVTHKLRSSEDGALRSIANNLSTRQLLRIARRLQKFSNEDAYTSINKACLARFLPSLAKDSLEKMVEKLGIQKSGSVIDKDIKCTVENGVLTIGQTAAKLYNPETRGKVPETLFYDTPQNLAVMEAMLQDFLLGEHLLLVGNQGTGKNKLVDRLLNLLNKPREYIQLNRDTTVQTLTLQPTVREGVIVYDDSPLVQAAKSGNILVVDEADKAPTNVTCILKSLVESGEMILSDGRRIVPPNSSEQGANIIPLHPDFRMLVLANRPGFPFLGNDFFGTLGDLFSCHVVDNPSMESELSMLRQYGPNVPEDIMRRVVKAFAELRTMADEGQIHYPYSTREVVNIVKHLEKFPSDGLGTVVRNVFDFDSYSKEVRDTLTEVLHKHGIPIGTDTRNVRLAKEIPLPPKEVIGSWEIARAGGTKRKFLRLPYEHSNLKFGDSSSVNVSSSILDRVEARGVGFSELQSYWSLPFHDFAVVGDVTTFPDKHNRPLYDTVHICTSNPVMLYTMQANADKFTNFTLNHFFDTKRQNLIPRPKMTPLGGKYERVLAIYDEVTGALVLAEPDTGTVLPITLNTIYDSVRDLKDRMTGKPQKKEQPMRMCTDFAKDNKLLFYTPKGRTIQMMDIGEGSLYKMDFPFVISSVHPLSEDQYLVVKDVEATEERLKHYKPQETTCLYLLKKEAATDPLPTVVNPIHQSTDINNILALDKRGLSDFGLKIALGEKTSSPNTMFVTPGSYINLAMGFPELEFSASEVYSWPKVEGETVGKGYNTTNYNKGMQKFSDPGRDYIFLKDSCQIVRPIPSADVPKGGVADHIVLGNCAAFLEVVDLMAGQVRYIPVPDAPHQSSYASWYKQTYPDKVLGISRMSNDGLATVDNSGTVRLWETGVANLERSLNEWKRMIGGDDDLTMTINQASGKDVDSPKHGKLDAKNDPHIGGNTWAGGTGGRDTAGLGGKGGPYRLDAGHNVHQVPEHEKDNVPDHVKKAARDMNRNAFAEKLREIKMSEYDAQLYEQYAAGVRKQVQTLRSILQSLQAKSQDRTWLKNQTSGDLDDNRLIDGLTGEKSIYKKRGEQDPEVGAPQEKPKRVKLVVDVSGSMYRFNGHDQRLERMMEATLMVMEGLEGFGDRIKFDICGHSGEESDLPFVSHMKAPENNKERLKVLKEMSAHSQFCMSGDHTLSAAVLAINELGMVADQYDESFVIVLSDANFDRYGIRPESFGKILNRNENVNAYAIFIGSLGNQADELSKRLPAGKSFVCMDTKKLPEILQTIFTAAMLK
eukprot:GFUD01041137.1.p1 GENE.GFUD01041137.1~~GFUD01041137.1.p1  ORF type:complete len:1900 (+),score=456.60 GFUD01041137.1:60-5702(+)